MKKIYTIFLTVLLTTSLFAQPPQKMSYQAVIRDDNSVLVKSHAVGMRISILHGVNPVYIETHSTSTNANGLVTIEIGGGTFVSGVAFSAIDWSAGTYSIKTETDPTGGINYTAIVGTSPLLSVPYALYAKTATSYSETDPIFVAWNKNSGISITASQVSDFETSVTNNSAVLANTAKNSYPSADAAKLAAITGTNTGDETTTTIKAKLEITTLSGSNTGDQDGSETKITAGTNVTVIGAGTSVNPYVINAVASLTLTQRDALTAVAGLMVYNTNHNKPNYYNGTEWMNFDGTPATVKIGDSYQGGKVFYIFQVGDPGYVTGQTHGLIAAVADQGTANTWYNGTYTTTGATGTALGTGSANTTTIIASQGNTGTFAAKICRDYAGGGYNDWYLPSKDELNKLYLNKVAIGGFAINIYWSSTESNSNSAWIQTFDIGSQFNLDKSNTFYVRAVRAF